ncbi:MAG: hypothetical protein KatS3mg059_1484 [Thermomicrobiales bacterium]|nr:MAG: hypothetical protein KatS3mg059_1484 [Thermomicrobiales bacterium]
MTTQHRGVAALSSALVLTLLLAGCAGSGAGQPEYGVVPWPDSGTQAEPRPGQRAPNFRLESLSGAPVTLAEFLGRPVLLNFFASWCANCREEMAVLDTASQQNVVVIGVNLRESNEAVSRLATETGASFPLLLDRQGTVTRAYRVSNLPATFAIDASGTVRDVVLGPVDAERLAALIHAASSVQGGIG